MAPLHLDNKTELPIGKIIGLGRNYAKHANEMGQTVPTVPIFFLKPASSYLKDGGTVLLPEASARVDPEVELAVVIGKTAKDITEARWKDFVLGYGVCLDMTARDLQEEAKKRGDPWALSKGFDTFTPISTIIDKKRVADPQELELQLLVNGEMRQHGHTKDMVFPVSRTIAYLSTVMTLEPGDVIATGTPEGVKPVQRGDKLEARIPGIVSLSVRVADRKTKP